jgi:hypothetical protein
VTLSLLFAFVTLAGTDAGTKSCATCSVPGLRLKPGASMEERQDKALEAYFAQVGDAGAPEPPPPPFQWRLKNVVGSIEIPGVQEANNVPVKLHSLVVKSNLKDILYDLIDQFQSQHLYMRDFLDQEQPLAQTQITAYDTFRGISYSAIIECLRDRPCTVMLGEANVGMAARSVKEVAARSDFVPLPSDAVGVQRSKTESYQTIAFRFPGPQDGVRAFYREALDRQGYREEKKDQFVRPGDRVQLFFKMIDGSNFVMLTRMQGVLQEE